MLIIPKTDYKTAAWFCSHLHHHHRPQYCIIIALKEDSTHWSRKPFHASRTLCHPVTSLDEDEVGCDNSLVPCQPCNRWVTQGCKPGPPLQQFGLSGALVFLDRVAGLFSIRVQTSTGPCTKLYSGDITILLWQHGDLISKDWASQHCDLSFLMAELFTPNLARIYAKSHGPSVLMSQRQCSAHFSRVYANFRRFMLHLVFCTKFGDLSASFKCWFIRGKKCSDANIYTFCMSNVANAAQTIKETNAAHLCSSKHLKGPFGAPSWTPKMITFSRRSVGAPLWTPKMITF